MLWIQKYVHMFSYAMEHALVSSHLLRCFQFQLRGFLPGTETPADPLKNISG